MAYKDPDKLAQKIVEWAKEGQEIAIKQATEYAKKKIKWEFKLEAEATGEPWKEVKESTLKEKLNKGFSEKTLHRTTSLKQSFSTKYEDGKGIVGTPIKYAIFHEEGTSKMPARPFMKPVMKLLEKEMPDIIETSLKKAGKK